VADDQQAIGAAHAAVGRFASAEAALDEAAAVRARDSEAGSSERKAALLSVVAVRLAILTDQAQLELAALLAAKALTPPPPPLSLSY